MKHYDQCEELLDTLLEATNLVRRIQQGDANAGNALKSLCRRISYEGYVLHLCMDEIIGFVIEGEE